MNAFECLKRINEEIKVGERKLSSKILDKAQSKQLQERLVALRQARIEFEAPSVQVDGLAAALHLQTQEPWRGRKNVNGNRVGSSL